MRLMRALALFQARPRGLTTQVAPSAARRVKETTWHEDQRVEDLPDGSVRLRLVVAELTELKPWVLGWGSACEVLGPPSFRSEIARETAAAAEIYATGP